MDSWRLLGTSQDGRGPLLGPRAAEKSGRAALGAPFARHRRRAVRGLVLLAAALSTLLVLTLSTGAGRGLRGVLHYPTDLERQVR